MHAAALLALLPALAGAVTVQKFVAPGPGPLQQSPTYAGYTNGSLPIQKVVPGKAYDRFITIWLENTDFATAVADPTFQKLASEGILLTNYNGVTHPSEPNYIASIAGDFFGMPDDDNYYFPYNVSTAVDLLESKNISWASYQENSPTDGFAGDYPQKNYLNSSATAPYTYYKRKHNPHILANSVAGIPDRALRVRNFNDFAADVNATALPQHVFVTPNLVNDGHDTDITFMSSWLQYWLIPLLADPRFNDNRTLIQLTFDETESYTIQNTVWTVLLGGAVPANLKGTNDSTFYTHYSTLSSIENNWDLPSLGRQDANKTVAAVWQFQTNITGYQNYVPAAAEIPQLNLTGIFPGVANDEAWIPVPAPDVNAFGAGNGSVFYNASATDLTQTAPAAPVNLTASKTINPIKVNPNFTYTNHSVVNASSPAAVAASSSAAAAAKSSGTTAKPSSAGRVAVAGAAGFAGVLVVAVAALL
ncbi:putative acid phosphatase [Vanrija pseudolonga]|uniref:Acid phosphatase n=1 Tax=Vanrija pseudolonga TaxID=143232 RepID=A0AAF0YFX5_9TREE|nr:putative acid phosphatase [Vanrija pseudolonga]